MVMNNVFEARPDTDKPWVWVVWNITHPHIPNHFVCATFDSYGAGDDFNESYAKQFAELLNSQSLTSAFQHETLIKKLQWVLDTHTQQEKRLVLMPGLQTALSAVEVIQEANTKLADLIPELMEMLSTSSHTPVVEKEVT